MSVETMIANIMRLQTAFIKSSGYEIKASVIEGKQGEYDYVCTKKVKANRASYADEYTPEFIEAWQVYPKLAGNSKIEAFKCFKMRLKEGVAAMDMIAGVNRYAAFIKATDRFVQLGSTFFGPACHFNDGWELPAINKYTLKLPSNNESLAKFASDNDLPTAGAGESWIDYRKRLQGKIDLING